MFHYETARHDIPAHTVIRNANGEPIGAIDANGDVVVSEEMPIGVTECDVLPDGSLQLPQKEPAMSETNAPADVAAPAIKTITAPSSASVTRSTAPRFDVLAVIRAANDGSRLTGEAREAYQEALRAHPETAAKLKGDQVFLPFTAISKALPAAVPAALAGEDIRSDLFTRMGDAAELDLMSLPFTMISSTESSVRIPVEKTRAKPTWKSVDAALDRGAVGTFDAIALTPRTLGLTIELEKSAVYASHPSLAQVTRDDLVIGIREGIAAAIIGPKGSDANRPAGLVDVAIAGASITAEAAYAGVRKVVTELVTARPRSAGSVVLIANPVDLDTWSVVPRYAGSQEPVHSFDGFLAGVPVVSTPMLASGTILAVDPREFVIAAFAGGAIVESNPYGETLWQRGAISLRVMLDLDMAARDVNAIRKASIAAPISRSK